MLLNYSVDTIRIFIVIVCFFSLQFLRSALWLVRAHPALPFPAGGGGPTYVLSSTKRDAHRVHVSIGTYEVRYLGLPLYMPPGGLS